MASLGLRTKPASPDPADTSVPRIWDDPAFAAADALRTTLRDHMQWLEAWKLRLALERQLDGKPEDRRSETDFQLRATLAKVRAQTGTAPLSDKPGSSSEAPAVAAALAVLNGSTVPPPIDYAAKVAEIDRRISTVQEGFFEQQAICDRIADGLTFEYARRLKPAWDALQLEMYRAAQELARAARRVREFRGTIVAAGIKSRSDVLAMPNVRAPLMLGDESAFDSEISGWRRTLEQLGIL